MDDEGSRNLKSNLKTGDPLTLIEKPTESFVVLSTTSTSNVLTAESVNRASLSFRLKVVKKIFDIISGKNEIDHPLCNDCAKILNEKLKQNLDKIKKEIVSYQSYYDQLRLNIRNSPEETETEIDINAEEEEINKVKKIKKR